jgi:HAD superfamily hydrolase (TIGR01509 family)
MKLKLPEGDFKAYLFDCDGTIADSMPQHYLAWKTVLQEWNCEFPEELFYEWGGMPVAKILSSLNERHGLCMPLDDLLRRKEEIFYSNLPLMKAVPEVLEHIEARHGEIPFAVVSGSTYDSVRASLTALNLVDRFEAFVCAGDYKQGKPHPEPFLLAAAKLGVAPEHCLVFEDAQLGIDAATAAGMTSVRIAAPWERAAALEQAIAEAVGNG